MTEGVTPRGARGGIHAFVGVGSNIRPEENVPRALTILSRRARLTGVSTFYQTAPIGAEGTDDFYNGVVEIVWEGDADGVRCLLGEVEDRLGRVRTTDPHAPRVIDLDLLAWRSRAGVEAADVHPDVTKRGFVALPLLELAPALVLGKTGRPLAEVARGFQDPPGRPLPELGRRLRSLVR